jgi:hypothetical protein
VSREIRHRDASPPFYLLRRSRGNRSSDERLLFNPYMFSVYSSYNTIADLIEAEKSISSLDVFPGFLERVEAIFAGLECESPWQEYRNAYFLSWWMPWEKDDPHGDAQTGAHTLRSSVVLTAPKRLRMLRNRALPMQKRLRLSFPERLFRSPVVF